MNKIIEKFNKMKTVQKVEFLLASLLTLALMIGLPVYAWFSSANNMETMTKIKEPQSLDIRAGNYNSIINFELSNINIENMGKNKTPEYRVFSVSAGDYKLDYKLQLAHTTNIPFKYSIFKATEAASAAADTVSYKPLHKDPDDSTTDGKTFYYKIGDEVALTPLNADEENASHYGRVIAENSGDYYNKTYDSSDTPERYAVPVYLQSEKISPTEKGEDAHDFFILKIEWDGQQADTTNFAKWNKAVNNKETDIIYLTAIRSTG